MQIATAIADAKGFQAAAKRIAELENRGLDAVWIAENSGFDAASRLGYLAAKTERVALGTNVMPIYTRNPTLMAMTAAGVDFLSDGRFNLGLGIGGVGLLEGFYGTTFQGSMGRMREVVDICRKVWAKDQPLVHDGRHYQVPLAADHGTGSGTPGMLLEQPVRPRIPIWLAAIGPQSVGQAAEIADGWLPLFFIPERLEAAWGGPLATGTARRDPTLAPLQISIGQTRVAIGEGEEVLQLRELARPMAAFFLGAIGPRGRNPYNLLAQRYGYEGAAKLIEDLWAEGKRSEAAAAVPAEFLAEISLIGPRSWVAERIAAHKQAGVTQLQVSPIPPSRYRQAAAGNYDWITDDQAVAALEELVDLVG
jgi:F420-dependent oxidoreductase-like protein